MDAETLARVQDPFFTTKHKKTGLGIPLLTQAAEQTGGRLSIDSAPGKGTRVTVTFGWDHLDRPPVGDMVGTLLTLIAGHPDRDYIYEEREGERTFQFDTREIKSDLEGVPDRRTGGAERHSGPAEGTYTDQRLDTKNRSNGLNGSNSLNDEVENE